MEWFNVFGLIYIVVIMIPNIVFAIKCKGGFDNKWNNILFLRFCSFLVGL